MAVMLVILGRAVVYADPPVVDSIWPGDSAVAVLSDETITASFSMPMDTSTLNDTTFLATGSISGGITGTFEFDTMTNSVIFVPDSLYASTETVYVELTTAIQSIFGDTLESPFTWEFYTCESPTVVDREPGTGEVNVPADLAEIRVTFSRAMDTSSITEQTFMVCEFIAFDPCRIIICTWDGDSYTEYICELHRMTGPQPEKIAALLNEFAWTDCPDARPVQRP
jgi:hypothetical protein